MSIHCGSDKMDFSFCCTNIYLYVAYRLHDEVLALVALTVKLS